MADAADDECLRDSMTYSMSRKPDSADCGRREC